MSSIRAVFFDVGGTLAHPRPSFNGLLAEVCCRAGLSVTLEAATLAEAAVWQKIAQREGGGRGFTLSAASSREFWLWVYGAFLDELGAPVPNEVIAEDLFNTFTQPENYQLYDDALPILDRLKAAGIRMGIISNWEPWAAQLLDALGIRDYFDCTSISGELGFEKPDPAIFRHALAAAGLTAGEVLHVGDNPLDDVAGARAAGLRAVLIDRAGEVDGEPNRPYLMIPPVVGPTLATDESPRIRSLLELAPLLGLS
ncbi:MAG: HAD family hydrolase [Chloroflexi bacterium]|nr:HAD family hydrolase [Chloroflexota bacterium]